MIGALFGDIAGSKFEFNNIKTKDFELMTQDCYFTDDSVCTIAIIDWLIHAKERNEKTITEYLHRWTRKYPNAGYGGRFWNWVHSDNPTPYNSCGNGSAMRVSPVAWAAKDFNDLRFLSDTVTKITHNHPEGMKGALVTATCVFMALHGYTKGEIKKYAISQYPEISTLDYEELKRTYFHGEEICQNTVPQAIYCFLISKNFHDCAKTTISIGGDCDTTSAISCAIAEAFYGVGNNDYALVKSHLPDDMKKVVDEASVFGAAIGPYPYLDRREDDPYNLERFVAAQRESYDSAVEELTSGRKTSHWMWYIFPQIKGLGYSQMSFEYGVDGTEEAGLYYKHKLLGPRLVELCKILLNLKSNDASRIFGYPDDMKLRSCMTLFYKTTNERIFKDVLDKFFNGELDDKTLARIENH